MAKKQFTKDGLCRFDKKLIKFRCTDTRRPQSILWVGAVIPKECGGGVCILEQQRDEGDCICVDLKNGGRQTISDQEWKQYYHR